MTHSNMNTSTDTKRLAHAVESLASTITEIIELKIQRFAEQVKLAQSLHQPTSSITAEAWVGQKEAAEQLKISRRTLYDWMQKESVPYVRIGRGVRFKLSQVDEAMRRRSQGGGAF
jgi:excisionase family DNA binding protein